jgi:hypothetical protein
MSIIAAADRVADREKDPDAWTLKIFIAASPAWRASTLSQYEKHIAVAEGRWDPGYYNALAPAHLRRKRKDIPEPFPPGLIAAFRKALPVLKSVIEILDTPEK